MRWVVLLSFACLPLVQAQDLNLKPYPVVANIEFPEGPTFDSKGNLYFVNYIRNGTIGKMTPDGQVSIWVDIPNGRGNGLKADAQDNIIVADYGGKRLLRISPEGKIETLADRFEGKAFLGINDVCLDRDGNIFFTDPTGSSLEKLIGSVYRYSRDGKVSRIDTGLAFPNGCAVSPDQKHFYVTESQKQRLLVYELAADGTASNRRSLFDFPTPGLDGIGFDPKGRLWVTRWTNQTVDVFTEEGKMLASIPAGGDRVTNITFWKGTPYLTVAGEHSIHRMDPAPPPQ